MANNEDIEQEEAMKESLLKQPSNKSLGGLRTLPFILANEGFEKAAYYGLQPSMILYLLSVYGLDMASGSNIIFLWCAATNFTPILGAFLADAYAGRFLMIGFGSVSALLGMMLIWTTTIIPTIRPHYEQISMKSTYSTPFQLIYLCIALALMSIGAGGIRSSSMAFGADQLSNIRDVKSTHPNKGSQALERFVNWYYFCSTASTVIGLTCIVYIQDRFGWQIGFAIPVTLMMVSVVSFFAASSFYVRVKPVASVLTRLAQVVVASWRNRCYKPSVDTIYHVGKGSVVDVPSEKLRFLNKACIVKNHQQDLTEDGMAIDPWRLCTLDQVEDLKTIINIIPLWSTSILLGVDNTSVASFVVVHAKSMDRHIISKTFEIPSASFGTFALTSVLVWIVLYDRLFIPLASKLMGKPVSISAITRMGIGLLLSVICMLVAGLVQSYRRENLDVPMSAMWLVPQVCLIGLAEGITSIAQMEFFYSEFPQSMSSISSNLFGLGMSISSLVASFIVSIINYVTKNDGKESWVSSDPNKGHYDYFYWVLACLSLLNYIYFLVCSRSFREKKRSLNNKIEEKNLE
ncbi:hypothetical protein RND81_03G150200 [Saponaria officinalis]|uniref:Uncharacterized protein n=1 Tax=Saponaria officinalis TaxID=3572 RepID=A0AAW1M0L3_SAPOF